MCESKGERTEIFFFQLKVGLRQEGVGCHSFTLFMDGVVREVKASVMDQAARIETKRKKQQKSQHSLPLTHVRLQIPWKSCKIWL